MFSKAMMILLSAVLALSWIGTHKFEAAMLPEDEVNVLNQIARTMGAPSDWNFDGNACNETTRVDSGYVPERNISCTCENGTCHVTHLIFKRQNLPGSLPSEVVHLPNLKVIDFAYNYLNGSIPSEWGLMQLDSISVFANRLSGPIPDSLGNISSLKYLDLEVNNFSGQVPPQLGKLVNLETLRLSYNRLSGSLPPELADLKNLTDFRINDNNLNGSIPDYIQNWEKLERLEMQGSGLEGPIPSSISALKNMEILIISDINGTNQTFPDLRNMAGIRRIILKKCNISGPIPEYVWDMSNLRVLDLSFNSLTGNLENAILPNNFKFLFLTGNNLTGNIPQSILRTGIIVDLSYNSFAWQSPQQPACQQTWNNVNLFRSSSSTNLGEVFQCKNDFKCEKNLHSLYLNCGGDDVKINGKTYIGDRSFGFAGGATLYQNLNNKWGFSSTGDFRDDGDENNMLTRFIATVQSSTLSELYTTARLSPQTLTYYQYCLENGTYNVTLHFAEIQFSNNASYASLGRRMFDIYIQDEVFEKDFDIEAEAKGALTPFTKSYNVSVTNGRIEIRFYWAGKGTQAIPDRGIHGALISAISLENPDFSHSDSGKENNVVPIIVGVLVGAFIIFLALGIVWWRYYFNAKSKGEKDLEGLDVQTVSSFTLKQIKTATNNFDSANKLGEGGFGPVYKGLLADGRVIAVKQLSSKSSQGNREFMNEIGMISCLQHPNLVRLYGCCIEGDQLLLVYEFLENNNLSRALFSPEKSHINLDWHTRHNICTGIARGLAFLHEESRLKIVHRDIKATNVLLDGNLNPKISDFGLAKLHEEEKTHISTRIAGTIGYIAPEYALWGYLTYKADIYSFGIMALEIVSGRHNMSHGPENKYTCLLDWACNLQQQSGELLELVDDKLGTEFNKTEAEGMVKIALLCTNASPSLRPTMSEVVGMLEGTMNVPEPVPEPGSYSQDLRFKAIREHDKYMNSVKMGASQVQSSASAGSSNAYSHRAMESQASTSVHDWTGSSTIWSDSNKFEAATLPQDEVNTLNQVARTMGNSQWNFNADACNVTEDVDSDTGSQKNITCTCLNGTCHVTHLIFKLQSLPGVLPSELVNLTHLKVIDFAYNYLSGSIPPEWASMQLEFISVFGNRLSGNIPSFLGNISSLTYLDLEANQFSGQVPPEIGKRLSSNKLRGNLPGELAELKNLTDFRINDNNFNGSIPNFVDNWKKLTRLEMQASGLESPIPSSISALVNLVTLIISDINGPSQPFPDLWNMTGITRMDLSFNSLSGELVKVTLPLDLRFLYLTGNNLSGNIPASVLQTGLAVDLSYNNFTWQTPEQPAYWHSMYINCGGADDVKINGTMYIGDAKSGLGGAATLYQNNDNWGFSSTGDFRDDNDELNAASRYLKQSTSMPNQLYTTARLSPLSLTYYRYCLENGSYTVRLHFAEIEITNNTRYGTLGRRLFNIYIQDQLVEEDFNIETEAGGSLTPLTKYYNANVTKGELEIRFYWAGKGTQAIPSRGVHGPLISAISVDPNFKPQHAEKKAKTWPIVVGVVGAFLLFLVSGVLFWRYYFKTKNQREKDLRGLDPQIVSFSLKQIKAATNNFDSVNKIGEGGFGPVYKGELSDGTIIAVKQLSSKSSQGNREFLNEMGMISCLQHPNLVKLYGCCIEGNQLLLVYEYMENNSLSRALFGPEYSRIKLDWPTRHKICVGIARGLAYLHEESTLKIVHRDIKGTNVLLDRDLNPKISDFGLAKLHEEEKTHISTRIAGTIGYIAPEYALWGYLTYKADVYSFGILALEIVSGKHNMNYGPEDKYTCLLDWACHLQQSGNLLELVDNNLGSEYNKSEAEGMIKVALLCTNASPSLRPTMSEVVGMLEGTRTIPDIVPNSTSYNEDLRFKAIREHRSSMYSQSSAGSQVHSSTSTHSGSQFESSSASAHNINEANEESLLKFKAKQSTQPVVSMHGL
ncbi:hypothetical protein CCACVL1_09617 [Corchorus capsularis]|uniref:non-specific serine/threonine protein kinase n=1 Tax=Corchorus capsularis TaxID=210143 RepID=A0A1R3IUV5_COCAP|nr:hypothetical protein CCACVL1_09617 [Corchorus capsularis]